MELPKGFEFMNDGSFPVFQRDGKGKPSKDVIYGYNQKNTKRSQIFLFGDVVNKRVIFKYIDRRKFVEYVKAQKQGFSLCFQQPSKWTDPYESRFYDADYSLLTDRDRDFSIEKHRKLYACCFAADKDSEPSWKMYIDEDNNDDRKVCIQLRINFKALLDYLNHFITNDLKGEYVLVVGRVTYKDKGDINKLHRPDDKGNLNSTYFDKFNFSKYLRLLLLKRNAYKYEDEIRMFLVPREGVAIKDNLVIPIPTTCPADMPNSKKWGSIVDKIIFDPNSKDSELDDYYKKLSNFGIDREDYVLSDLYDDFSTIKIGESKEEELKRKTKDEK